MYQRYSANFQQNLAVKQADYLYLHLLILQIKGSLHSPHQDMHSNLLEEWISIKNELCKKLYGDKKDYERQSLTTAVGSTTVTE